MARPVTVSTERIITAAREVFLEKGYDETTTLAIAQRAGVSEGSLFKRFPAKAHLFCAAMDLPPLTLPDTLRSLVGQGDLQDNMRRIATELIGFLAEVLPKAMMLWSQRTMSVQPPPPGSPPLEVLRALTEYFTTEMELGRIRPGDPQIISRLFQGACWSYVFLQLMTDRIPRLPREEYVDRLVTQLWTGMAPAGQPAAASSAPSAAAPARSSASAASLAAARSSSGSSARRTGRHHRAGSNVPKGRAP
jgi:AcrR family transcriptional regulator